MGSDHKKRRLGRLFYATAIGSAAILASAPFWPMAIEQFRAWESSRGLRAPSAKSRDEAAESLVGLGAAAIPWAVSATRDADPRVRILACSILRRIAPADQAIGAFAFALKDPDASVRRSTAERLSWEAGSLATRAGDGSRRHLVDGLRSALVDGDSDVRVASARALRSLGSAARSATADLERALAASDPATRLAAAQALLQIDPGGSRMRVVSVAQSMLADPTVQLHRHDLVRLLKDEAGEDRAAEALIALLGHDELWIRHDAISSLIDQCLGAAATRPALVRALDAADGGLRCEAAFYFLRQDPASASRALDVLIAQLLEPMEGGYLSLDIIRKLRDDSPASVGPVAARMAESLGGTAARDLNAILALAAIGPPEATRAVPALDRVAVSGERDVAIRAVALLATLDRRAAASHVPALLEWMGRGHPVESRLAAMNALGELGALAKSVVPKLIEAAEEDEIRISSAAIAALSRIDPPSGLALKRSILSGE